MHIFDYHILTVIYSLLHGFILNQQNDLLPVNLLAQSVEHSTGIAEVMGPNTVQALVLLPNSRRNTNNDFHKGLRNASNHH